MRYQIVIQVVAVIFILSLPLFLFPSQNQLTDLTSDAVFKYLGFCSIFVLVYLLHTYILFPKLFSAKKYTAYTISLLILLAAISFTKPYDKLIRQWNGKNIGFENRRTPPPHFNDFSGPPPMPPAGMQNPNGGEGPFIDVISVFIFLLVVVFGIAKQTSNTLRITMRRAQQAETEKAHAELAFLKAQVNPHLLFNVLNNIYTLAVIKDENTAPSIMKLSNLMRYITDDANEESVDLEKEINSLRDFIALQKLRLTAKTTVAFDVEGNVDHHKIAPLILMAFVENAFKYGVSNHQNTKITIKIDIVYHTLLFSCQNDINQGNTKIERTGIGLTNTKKRLSSLYPDRHNLIINDDKLNFIVDLKLQL